MKELLKSIIYKCLRFHNPSEDGIVWGSPAWKNRFARFGDGSIIVCPSIIRGEEGIYIGNNTTILENSRMQNYFQNENYPQITIGDRCYIGFYFSILNASCVTVGDDVLIASHVLITSENHGINPESDTPYMDQPLISKPVIIGDGCWIGEKAIITPGVTIGKKSIIGAGSIVTRSVPDYCIAVGNPAKVIKKYNFNTHLWETVKE